VAAGSGVGTGSVGTVCASAGGVGVAFAAAPISITPAVTGAATPLTPDGGCAGAARHAASKRMSITAPDRARNGFSLITLQTHTRSGSGHKDLYCAR